MFQITISAQVTLCNLERLINRDRRSRAGDNVAQRGAFDRAIKSRSLIVTKTMGVRGTLLLVGESF